MAGIGKYSVEWFIQNQNKLTKDQKKAIENLKDGAKESKDVQFSNDLFLGTASEVRARFGALERVANQSSAIKEQVDIIKKFGGIENVLKIIDENSDGKITAEEISHVAEASTAFFQNEVDENLSSRDLEAIFRNAIAAEGGTYKDMGTTSKYHFKNGIVSEVREDESGNATYKYLEISGSNGSNGHGRDYTTQITYDVTKDKHGRVTELSIDAPGKNDDKSYTIKYDDDNMEKTVNLTTAGTKKVTRYESGRGKVSEEVSYKYDIDGVIGDTKQRSINECWLLSGVNALAQTDKGAKLIKDAIKKNPDGSVTVTLKGVNKNYTFTPDEIGGRDYTRTDLEYSTGDDDMLVIELAVNRYRQEQIANNQKKWDNHPAELNNPLNMGSLTELFYLFTGKNPEYTKSGLKFTNFLEKKANNSERYVSQVSFSKDDPYFGTGIEIVKHHAYVVKSVTEDTVYLINPHDSSKEIAYPKDKLFENGRDMALLDLSKVK